MESKTFRIALNCAQKPNRGLAYENDLTVYNTLTREPWLDAETHTDEVYTVTYDGTAVTADSTGKVFTLPTGDKITIMVVPTNEELAIAQQTYDLVNK